MKTDHWFYSLFQSAPDLITLLLRLQRWDALTPEQRRGFPPLCPDLVVELATYQANGAQLGWLLIPEQQAVEVWTAAGGASGNPLFPGLHLDLLVIAREPSIPPERQLPLWQELRTALGDVGVPVDLLVYGQREAVKLGGSRWHVLGHAARGGRVLYVAECCRRWRRC